MSPAIPSSTPSSSGVQSNHTNPEHPSYQPQESTRGRLLTYQELSRCFHLPINSAASKLGVCVTALKKQCRKHGVQRWPHRKLKSLDKLKEKLEKEEATAADKEYYKHEIHSIVKKKDHIFRASETIRVPNSSQNRPAPTPCTSDAIATSAPIGTSSVPPVSTPISDPRLNPHASSPYVTTMPEQTPTMPPQQAFMVGTPIPVGAATQDSSQPPSHNGTSSMVPPLGMPPTHMSLCGITGCDCCYNGGVSSQNLHMPISMLPRPLNQTQMPPSSLLPSPPIGPHVSHVNRSLPGGPPLPPYYGVPPPGYGYPSHMPYVAPAAPTAPQFHNMVQVNVMDHQSYHHAAAAAIAAQSVVPVSQQMPQSSQSLVTESQSVVPTVVNPPLAQTPHTSPHLVGPSASSNPYDMYNSSQMTQPVAPSTSMIYGGTSTNGQASSGRNQQRMSTHYWASGVGQAPGANNTFAMYNQSTHYRRHHRSEECGANGPDQACSSRRVLRMQQHLLQQTAVVPVLIGGLRWHGLPRIELT